MVRELGCISGTLSQVERKIRQTAEADGKQTQILIEQEPGSSGKALIDHYQRDVLDGYAVRTQRPTGDKTTRAQPLSAAAEAGRVFLIAGGWNKEFLDEAQLFPNSRHDDQIDAIAAAHTHLTRKKEINWGAMRPVGSKKDSAFDIDPSGRRFFG